MTFIQRPMFDPHVEWELPRLADLPSWEGARRVAIDLETCDPELKETGIGVRRAGYAVGVAFAIDGGPSAYLPIAHATGPNLDAQKVIQYLRDQAAVFRGEIVGANLPYDLDYLLQMGIEFRPSFFRDVQIAEPLLDELQHSYSLAAIAKRHGIPGKSEAGLKMAAAAWGLDPKAEMWKLPAKHVARYAVQDVELPLELIRRQHRAIEQQNLWQIYDLESRVLPVLVKMRRRGVRVDAGRLDRVEQFCDEEIGKALDQVRALSGVVVAPEELSIAEALAKPLEAVGFTLPLTDGRLSKRKVTERVHTGREIVSTPDGLQEVDVYEDVETGAVEVVRVGQKPKTDKATLEALDHPVAAAILRAKRFDKVRGTFVASVRRHMVDGRLHPTFRQLRGETDFGGDTNGAAFGRLSCVDPNLQQQPARDPELGKLWRSIYVPEEGALWACCDFSSQEPRLAAHYASRAQCDGAEGVVGAYRENPRLDFHQKTADLAGINRKDAKAIALGRMYGMGGAKLCASLGLPTRTIFSKRFQRDIEVAGPEGQEILDKFDEMVPWVRQLSEKTETRARRMGVIRTLGGRHCRFPKKADGSGFDWTFKALNRLIQGSAADQGKQALVDLDAAGFPLQLQVHDEFDLSVGSVSEAKAAAEIMVNAIQLEVPTIVDVEVGPSWGEIEEIAS